ncbi:MULTISPECIES: gas vesicle protein [Streptomyces]|uniref:Gas vesicle protein n=1 Tax=Streptomyces katrae TaxID=68223 RepID=A0ABT7GPQ4_9ACTN|nr:MULTISPECIES: gas vesicle protein [Streptomyces]MDK9495567.1 gas vesicle protein [Streptomyces katrae]RST07027.1 gas vesicle protein [Streptomyces sp. WAC07149]GLX21661.1 gas vesicle protein [Streptomyces lavendulae subsp. lavendulae]GLX29078.1 gas vesicle protein [Streptomyces lavendulae subsp. lavendulae]
MAAAEPARRRRPEDDDGAPDAQTSRPRRKAPARRAPAPARSGVTGAAAAMRLAAGQLAQLLGRTPESVSSLRPTEEGWEAQVEVVELERIPDTTSVLASYRVSMDEDGELISYERTRRYSRGMIDRPA